MGNTPSGEYQESNAHGLKGGNSSAVGKGDNSIPRTVELHDFSSKFGSENESDNNSEGVVGENKGVYTGRQAKVEHVKMMRNVESPTIEVYSDSGTSGTTTPPVIIDIVSHGECIEKQSLQWK